MKNSNIISLFSWICFSSFFCCLTFADENQDLLARILLDAQVENRSKINGGEMSYRLSNKIGNSKAVVIDATVKWDKERAFWTYKLSDPSKTVTEGLHTSELKDSRTEYMLRVKDKLYSYNAYTNTLHEMEFDKIRRTNLFSFFDVFPDSLGDHCCFPFQWNGRLWSEMTGSKYRSLFPDSKLELKRTSKNIIQQKLSTTSGMVSKMNFSLDFSGYPLEIEYLDGENSSRHSLSKFEWMKTNNITVLKKFKIIRGDFLIGESAAKELIEFETLSFKNSKSNFSFDLTGLKSLLPKNTVVVDQIRNKSYPLFSIAKKQSGITDDAIDRLGQEVKKEGFLKP
jgi:hypothetical protein